MTEQTPEQQTTDTSVTENPTPDGGEDITVTETIHVPNVRPGAVSGLDHSPLTPKPDAGGSQVPTDGDTEGDSEDGQNGGQSAPESPDGTDTPPDTSEAGSGYPAQPGDGQEQVDPGTVEPSTGIDGGSADGTEVTADLDGSSAVVGSGTPIGDAAAQATGETLADESGSDVPSSGDAPATPAE